MLAFWGDTAKNCKISCFKKISLAQRTHAHTQYTNKLACLIHTPYLYTKWRVFSGRPSKDHSSDEGDNGHSHSAGTNSHIPHHYHSHGNGSSGNNGIGRGLGSVLGTPDIPGGGGASNPHLVLAWTAITTSLLNITGILFGF